MVILVIAILSCQQDVPCTDPGCQEQLVERTDILIGGSLTIWDNQVVEIGEGTDGPVSLNFYDSPSEEFDVLIRLESGYDLTLRLTDKAAPDPQENVNVRYPSYPGQDLGDKLRYVTAELRSGTDAAAWSTNDSGYQGPPAMVGSLRITSNDGEVIRARIKGLNLYYKLEYSKKIEINGTFAAVIDQNGAK